MKWPLKSWRLSQLPGHYPFYVGNRLVLAIQRGDQSRLSQADFVFHVGIPSRQDAGFEIGVGYVDELSEHRYRHQYETKARESKTPHIFLLGRKLQMNSIISLWTEGERLRF